MKLMHAKMKSLLPLLQLPLAAAFECTQAAFQDLLPSTASIEFAVQLQDNGTFKVPAGNIAYPVSPTMMQASCAVQVNVTSSPESMFSFGLFLPVKWNKRFLAGQYM